MRKWKRLDLRIKDQRPETGQLVALRLVSKSGNIFSGGEQYDIGYLKPDRDGKKLWFHTGKGSSFDPVRLKQRHDIWWCYVAPFDGM